MSSIPAARPQDDPLAFLSGGANMGARIRAEDWTATPLGPAENWPPSLKILISVILGSHQPMFVAWGPNQILLYNDSYAPLLGQRHPGALGRPFAEVWYDIIGDVGSIMDSAYAGESTQMDDIAFTMNRNGYPEETHFSFSYTPIREDGGAVCGVFCVCAETTEQVMAERRRVDSARRLQQLFDNAPGFMAVVRGPDHVFEMMNRSYLQLVGHRDPVGMPIRQALPELEGQGFFELLDQVYRSGEAFAGRSMKIYLQRTPDAPAEERLLDFVFQPIVEPGGDVSGIFAEGYDVTERYVAEQAVRESEERFRLIADSAPVPIWVTKLDRKRGFVNRAYVEFMGLSYDEALDYDWHNIIHPDDAERVFAESAEGEKSLQQFVLEGRFRRGDGEWRWLRSISQPRLGPGGEHIGFIGVAHDITEWKLGESALREVNETLEARVAERTADLSAALDRLQAEVGERQRAEDALRQAQKMEAVGQLTGGIAHDFNNLLTPIMGGLDIIANRVEDPRLKRIAETALESSRRGAKLTSQLLAFSRIQRISMAPVAVNQVIEKLKTLLHHTIGGGIEIETDLDPDAGRCICDANQLENAILNLAINSRDAMPDGGTLTITTAPAALKPGSEVEAGNFVRISVADTGEGMTPETLARATEPFFSTKPMGKGTGLGLAQVYGITRQASGTVRIESDPGEGTVVHLFFPAASGEESAETSQEEPSAEVGGGSEGALVLIIDDDNDVRAFLADSINGLGYKAVTAENGAEGLSMLAECAPDIALVDYAMPGMHGAEVAREARRIRPDLPIIFVTGYAETGQLEAALGDDVQVLRKPFSIADLAAAVERNLAKSAS